MGNNDSSILYNRIFPVTENVLGTIYTASRQENWTNHRTTSANLPDWKLRIVRGENASTTLVAHSKSISGFGSGLSVSNIGTTYGADAVFGYIALLRGDLFPMSSEVPDAGLYSTALGIAEENFVKSYRSARQQVNAGQFIGELRQTLNFIRSPLKSLEKMTLKLGDSLSDINKKLRQATASQKLRAITDTWLAYQYAAKPLANDAAGAYQLLKKNYIDNPSWDVIRIIGTGSSESITPERIELSSTPTGPGYARIRYKAKQSCSVRLIGAYKVSISHPGDAPVWDAAGLSPDNWAPTSWEIIPYSFVVDYFTNAGRVIDAYAASDVDFEWINQTTRQEITRVCVGLVREPGDTDPRNYAYGGAGTMYQKDVSRYPHANSFAPPFRLKIPGLGQGLNLAALANTFDSLKRLKW